MPNINEFLGRPEKIFKNELEKMGGEKPCNKCDKNSEEYFEELNKNNDNLEALFKNL